MHLLDVAIIGAFIVYAIVSGLRSRATASQSLEEYFLAGRSLSGWKAGISMAATQFAADTPLVVMGLVATAGIFSLWRMWIYALAFLLLGFVLAPSWRRAGVLTDAELTELRYGAGAAAPLRGIKAIYFGTIFNCAVLAMVLLAATRIAEPFLTWDAWLPAGLHQPFVSLVQTIGVPLTADAESPRVWILSANNLISIGAIVLTTLFYSTTGGLRSVVQTDVAQFFLALVATLLYAGYVIHEVGGLGELTTRLRALFGPDSPLVASGVAPPSDQLLAFTPSQARDAGLVVLSLYAIQWIAQMNADGTGYLAQRSMACKSDRDARLAAVVFTYAQVLARSLLWLPIGLGLLLVFQPDAPPADAEQYARLREATYVRGIAELLPLGIKGLMLTGMLAALASTVDTHLNWGSSYWTNDIYKRFVCQAWRKTEPDPKNLVWVARAANIMILCIALVVMTQLGSIQQAWRISLLLGAGMGVMLVLRWVWWRISSWGELACIGVSLPLAPLFLWLLEPDPAQGGLTPAGADALRLLSITACTTTAGVLVSLLTPEDRVRLRAFYRRARPPGWWGPIARECGVDPQEGVRRLGKGVLGMLAAAGSVFCLLVGAGSWLCDSPAPTWWPLPRPGWWALNLLAGVALVPVWLRLGFSDPAEAQTDVIDTIDPVSEVGRLSDMGSVVGEVEPAPPARPVEPVPVAEAPPAEAPPAEAPPAEAPLAEASPAEAPPAEGAGSDEPAPAGT